MVDSSGELEFGWLEWIVSWEVDVEEEHSTDVWGVIGTHDGGIPVILVFLVDWSS